MEKNQRTRKSSDLSGSLELWSLCKESKNIEWKMLKCLEWNMLRITKNKQKTLGFKRKQKEKNQ